MTQPIQFGEDKMDATAEAVVSTEAQKEAVEKEFEGGWEMANLETETTPIIDQGVGKAVVIREFLFQINPEIPDLELIDKQVLFNAHAKQIATMLWGDGLRPLEENPPRVIIDVKNKVYRIFVPCEARLGVVFADKTRNLSEELKKGQLDKPTA